MSDIQPGWYRDPVDATVQRYWDGEGWLGEPIAADAEPPPGPPEVLSTSDSTTETSPEPPAAEPEAQVPAGPPGWPPGYPPAPPGYPVPPGYPLPPGYPARVMPRPHGFRIAGTGRRLAARAIDFAAVAVLCTIANGWFAYQLWQAYLPYLGDVLRAQRAGATIPQPPASAANLIIMMCLVATAVWFAYEVPGSANTGQTLGKRLVGIKVMRLESVDRLGFGRAFRRWGRLGLPTLFWWCYGVGFVLQALDCLFVLIDRPLQQALHDKSAGTVVVQLGGIAAGPPAAEATVGGRHADPR